MSKEDIVTKEQVKRLRKKLKDGNLQPIPHLPARTIQDYNELERYLGKLAEISGVNRILIIGGSGNKKGNA